MLSRGLLSGGLLLVQDAEMSGSIGRRALAELICTALLVAAVIGSGIAASRMSPRDLGLELFENAAATGAALVAIILAVGPVSGAHLNPGQHDPGPHLRGDLHSRRARLCGGSGCGWGCRLLRLAVGAYISAAYFFTSSMSFANPAVTIGRTLSNTFAGIRPVSAPLFIAFQLVGGAVAAGAIRALYPDAWKIAPQVVVPHRENGGP